MKRIILAAALVGAVAPLARADEPAANPARPTFSDNARSMAVGYLEIEGGVLAAEGDQYATPFSVDLGFQPWLEVRVFGEGLRHSGGDDSNTGLGNVGIAAKIPMIDEQGARPAFGLLFSGIALRADSLLGGSNDVGALLLASGTIGRIGWDANVGVNILGLHQDDPVYEMPAILALSTAVTGPVGVSIEVADFIPLEDQDNRLFLLGAATYSANPRLVFDVAFASGIVDDEPTPSWTVTAGVTALVGSRLF